MEERPCRDVGPYLGLVPKQEDSGESQPQYRNQQSRGHDDAPAAGRKRALYFGAVRTGHGFTTIRAAVMRTRWEECEEESGGSGGPEAGSSTAPALGEWRSI